MSFYALKQDSPVMFILNMESELSGNPAGWWQFRREAIRWFDSSCGQRCLPASFGDVHSETTADCGEEQPRIRKLINRNKEYPGKVQGVNRRCPASFSALPPGLRLRSASNLWLPFGARLEFAIPETCSTRIYHWVIYFNWLSHFCYLIRNGESSKMVNKNGLKLPF